MMISRVEATKTILQDRNETCRVCRTHRSDQTWLQQTRPHTTTRS